jgi:D-alanyl-D-alanine carboxypeptidase (penicillin-binding protein 5/6)
MDSGSEKRQGPAHARGRTLPKGNEERLAELGKQLPPPGDDELEIIRGLRASRLRRRLLAWCIALVVLALLAGAIAQWVRPLPSSTLQVVSVRLPGAAPTFAWPSAGEAAASVEGIGALGQVNGTKPVPVAGLAEVLTAYVVLSDHHLAPGADGPSVPVTSADISAYQAGLASQESEITLTAGESVTQLQALEGMLIDSGSDMATVLANWDAGTVGAFVAKMNAAAARLGMTSTHITDPSGVDPATTSTAEDLVRLGQAALSIPVLGQIVSLGQASVPIPGTTTAYNLNFDLGQDGIVGIDTGSDSSSQGCYLVAAQQNVGGKQVTVVGAVLGQPGGSLGPNTAAVDAGDTLVKSIDAALHSYPVFTPGQKAGAVLTAWGASAPVTVAQPVTVVGWPGVTVRLVARPHLAKGGLAAGASVGTLSAGVGNSSARVDLRTAAALSAPGVWWRLTR